MKNISNSPRLKEIRKRRQASLRNKFLIGFFGIVLIFGSLAYFSKLPGLNIQNIEISGNRVLDKEPIEKLIRENLSGKYLWLFPKTNFLIYPKNKIKENLTKEFARIKNPTFNLNNQGTLSVSFLERDPKYTWCGESLPEDGVPIEDLKCYFLDETGYIFDEAPRFSGEVYFKFFGKIENIVHPYGINFMKEDFENLISFKENLEESQVKPQALYVKSDGDVEIILTSNLSLKKAPRVVFKKDSDFRKMAENLQSALAVDPLREKFEDKYNTLQYIDLRFGNKVYYKFND